MLHKLRRAMIDVAREPLQGEVEVRRYLDPPFAGQTAMAGYRDSAYRQRWATRTASGPMLEQRDSYS
jgi:hypothetical protein